MIASSDQNARSDKSEYEMDMEEPIFNFFKIRLRSVLLHLYGNP